MICLKNNKSTKVCNVLNYVNSQVIDKIKKNNIIMKYFLQEVTYPLTPPPTSLSWSGVIQYILLYFTAWKNRPMTIL